MEADLPAGLTTSPTSSAAASSVDDEQPLALVKRKIKIEPGLVEDGDSVEDQYDPPMDFGEALKDEGGSGEDESMSMAQRIVIAARSNAVNENTVPDLKDIIPPEVNGKYVRPFKAYNANRELGLSASSLNPSTVPVALSRHRNGATAVPLSLTTAAVTVSSSNRIQSNGGTTTHAHLMTLATEADKLLKTKSHKIRNGFVKVESGSSDEAMTPGSYSAGSDSGSGAGDLLETTIEKIKKRAALAASPVSVVQTQVSQIPPIQTTKVLPRIAPKPSSDSHHSTKKSKKDKDRPSRPENNKDDHYWERRRKNNEAAKRSRDSRRAKEDQIAIRAALLEQENMRLRIEVAALKEETVKLRAALYQKNN